MKKITILAIAAFTAAFGAYKAFDDLVKSLDNWEEIWDEESEDLE